MFNVWLHQAVVLAEKHKCSPEDDPSTHDALDAMSHDEESGRAVEKHHHGDDDEEGDDDNDE